MTQIVPITAPHFGGVSGQLGESREGLRNQPWELELGLAHLPDLPFSPPSSDPLWVSSAWPQSLSSLQASPSLDLSVGTRGFTVFQCPVPSAQRLGPGDKS